MTTYIRGKREERGNSNEVFMMDGFDRWAESDAPNRVGGMYKEPAERGDRHRSSRKLDMFDSDSDSSCSRGSRNRHRRRGGARNHYSDSSDSSDYSSDSSDSDSDYEFRGGAMGLGGPELVKEAVRVDYVEEPNWANLVDYLVQKRGMTPAEAKDHVKEMRGRGMGSGSGDKEWVRYDDTGPSGNIKTKVMDYVKGTRGRGMGSGSGDGTGLGRRRRHRRSSRGSMSSGSEGDESASESEVLTRRAGGNLPNIVQYADMAQQGYDMVKSYLPDSAKQYVDKIFGLYNTIKTNATLFKKVLESVQGANATSALNVKSKLEQLGFGRMPMKHSYKAMKMLDRSHGTRTHKLLKKMFGAGFLTDQAGEAAYKLAPFGKDTAKNLARSAVDKLISSNATAKKIDGFVESGVDMYNNVKANMPLIRSAMSGMKTRIPASAASIDKVDGALKAVGLGRKGKRQPSQRNMMVSKLMREKGLSLGEASKQVSAMLKGGVSL